MSEALVYDSPMLAFVDETGSDKRSSLRKYGYSPKGTPAIAEKMLVKSKRHSAIAAIYIDGVLDVRITTNNFDKDEFYKFIELSLLPQLVYLLMAQILGV